MTDTDTAERDPVRTAIGLLNSMLRGGESHSEESAKIVVAGLVAYDALAAQRDAMKAEWAADLIRKGKETSTLRQQLAEARNAALDEAIAEIDDCYITPDNDHEEAHHDGVSAAREAVHSLKTGGNENG